MNFYQQMKNTLDTATKNKFEKIVGRAVLDGYRIAFFGSRTIDGAWTKDSDFDILVCVHQDINRRPVHSFERVLERNGFTKGGSTIEGPEFTSWRGPGKYGEKINIVPVYSPDIFRKMKGAQEICVSYNIVDKARRIQVFDFMCERIGAIDGNSFTRLLEEEENKYSFSKGKRPKASAMGRRPDTTEIPF